MVTEDEINQHVGRQLRKRRTELGKSQTWVGRKLSISMQQIQKYEWNINRLSVGRLYQLAEALEVPIMYFFPEPGRKKRPTPTEPPPSLKFVRLLNRIHPKHYDQVFIALKAIAQLGAGGDDEAN